MRFGIQKVVGSHTNFEHFGLSGNVVHYNLPILDAISNVCSIQAATTWTCWWHCPTPQYGTLRWGKLIMRVGNCCCVDNFWIQANHPQDWRSNATQPRTKNNAIIHFQDNPVSWVMLMTSPTAVCTIRGDDHWWVLATCNGVLSCTAANLFGGLGQCALALSVHIFSSRITIHPGSQENILTCKGVCSAKACIRSKRHTAIRYTWRGHIHVYPTNHSTTWSVGKILLPPNSACIQNLGILGNLGPVHEPCTVFIRILGNLGPVQVSWLQWWRKLTKRSRPKKPKNPDEQSAGFMHRPKIPKNPKIFGTFSSSQRFWNVSMKHFIKASRLNPLGQ